MATIHKQTPKPAAASCYICEKALTGQPVDYLDIGFMFLAACKSCVAGGEKEDFDEEQGELFK